MTFANPYAFLALLPIFALIFFHIKYETTPTIKFSDSNIFHKIEHKSSKYVIFLKRYTRYLLLVLIVLTLAQPQILNIEQEVDTEGIDIMLVLDTSESMAAEDLQPYNRLEVAKSAMREFISKRKSDRIGLVVFGTDAYTQAPLSVDYSIIGSMFDSISLSMAGNGTAIGMAIATGLNRLKQSKDTSKIMVLLTDGENNSGQIDPLRAAELSRDLDVKIYTIGVGKEGGARIPYMHPIYGKVYSDQLTSLDEKTLKAIASITNGAYFRATDTESLQHIYETIDELETSTLTTQQYVQHFDFFPYLLLGIASLMVLELIVFNLLYIITP